MEGTTGAALHPLECVGPDLFKMRFSSVEMFPIFCLNIEAHKYFIQEIMQILWLTIWNHIYLWFSFCLVFDFSTSDNHVCLKCIYISGMRTWFSVSLYWRKPWCFLNLDKYFLLNRSKIGWIVLYIHHSWNVLTGWQLIRIMKAYLY